MTNPTATVAAALEVLADRIERAGWLDRPGDVLAGVAGRVVPSGRLGDVLTGTVIGHPLHPALVGVPIGAWASAAGLDLSGTSSRAARWLVGFGIVAAVPSALTGLTDWLTTSGAERRVGSVHASFNSMALLLYTGSWLARRRGDERRGVALAMAGLAATSAAGWLGGHLAYALGVGVDTTAFQQLPEDWTDVGSESDVPAGRPVVVEAAGVPVLLFRSDDDWSAIADRCTHRGGPLHEGEVSDGCVTCPWHGSEFALSDGALVSGPASRPQPAFDVRVLAGRVQVRRADEPRTLRTHPVGV
jgi:nitrite reductase/ring-hydroxylating ferredoxin subunit/uncharacterized membrane protein